MDKIAVLILIAGTAAVACTKDRTTVGTVLPRDRTAPIGLMSRSQLTSQSGVICTPNETGPVLCTWTSGGTTCELTYDESDSLTRIHCTIEDLTWDCTRPGDLYVCSWSDDPGCGDVYGLDGLFEAHLCDPALQDRINGTGGEDGGVSDPDASEPTPDPDAGSDPCTQFHDEESCSSAPPICAGFYCEGCGGARTFQLCARADQPPPACPPVICPDCSTITDQTTCEQQPGCHGIYEDLQLCGCAPAGCCTMFVGCGNGPADCAGLDLACRQAEPHCEGPYVVSYSGSCYEGCALATACNPAPVDCTVHPAAFPILPNGCAIDADCAVGIRQLDCCGADTAVGINLAELDRFNRGAAICNPQFPECECLDRGIETQDGTFAIDAAHVAVTCDAMRCMTHTIP